MRGVTGQCRIHIEHLPRVEVVIMIRLLDPVVRAHVNSCQTGDKEDERDSSLHRGQSGAC